MNILEVRDLTCGYEGNVVLKDVCLNVTRGEMLGVIGPNGAGKTTLFRAVTKLLTPMSGTITVEGADLRALRPAELARRVSVVPQMSDLPFAFTVREFVALGRYPHLKRFQRPGTADEEAIDRAIRHVDVGRLAGRRLHQLSAGEKQRVLLAQALAQEPRLLLLDEPISHLDIRHQMEMLDLCRSLNVAGLTMVFILHDLNLAAEYCRRLALFHEGRLVACGASEKILDYRLIEEVYRTVVIVRENPISKKPYVLLVSKDALRKRGQTTREDGS